MVDKNDLLNIVKTEEDKLAAAEIERKKQQEIYKKRNLAIDTILVNEILDEKHPNGWLGRVLIKHAKDKALKIGDNTFSYAGPAERRFSVKDGWTAEYYWIGSDRIENLEDFSNYTSIENKSYLSYRTAFFEPHPDYPPTQVLISKLRENGFSAQVITLEEKHYNTCINDEANWDSNDYCYVKNNYLIISWEDSPNFKGETFSEEMSIDKAIALFYDLRINQKFTECDKALKSIKIEKLEFSVLVSILTVLKPVASKLKEFKTFSDSVALHIKNARGLEKAKSILVGLYDYDEQDWLNY